MPFLRGAVVATNGRPAAADGGDQITADDLRQMARALGLVPIPDHVMAKVLTNVRAHRAAMRTFDDSGIDVAGVFTAQPYRV